jgi:muramoyltetrapeptide carboxypeptidase LdcA involved in peptidoglycan recycling
MTRTEGNSSLDNVKLRAQDINAAFADREVKAVFASIRILPFIDINIIKNNPKIFMGYSDTTTMLTYFNLLGLVTFNGPSVMASFSQAENLPKEFTQHVYDILFKSSPTCEYPFFGS